VQSALMQMAWPSIKLTHPDLFARTCSATSSPRATARGWPAPCRDAGLTYAIDSSSFTPQWANGTFVISARLAPEKVDAAHKAILDLVAAVQERLVSGGNCRRPSSRRRPSTCSSRRPPRASPR